VGNLAPGRITLTDNISQPGRDQLLSQPLNVFSSPGRIDTGAARIDRKQICIFEIHFFIPELQGSSYQHDFLSL
tara:strand:- start:185274 stop:185495 length:222 start_codon:yes stop_codon:yes gene_type:complete